jgi:hypothetical protein
MTTPDVVKAARHIADEVGVEWGDLTAELPKRQVALIRDRVARAVEAARVELYMTVAARAGNECPRCEGSKYVPHPNPEGKRLYEPCAVCVTTQSRQAA